MSINFLKFRKIYFVFSAILIIASIVCLSVFSLKPGIDFTGGSILELDYAAERPDNQTIRESLGDFGLGEFYIQPTGDRGVILRMKDISEDTHQEVLQKLADTGEFQELSFESIGPVIGKELKEKTKVVVVLALFAIVLYIAFVFRRLTFPAKSWQYGVASLFILSHDVLIPLAVFSLLGKFYGVEMTIPIICALLTVIGYAINNVVVVYDRLRENLLKARGADFEKTVNLAINQTLTRQINTSLTTLFPLLAIFFLGGATLKYFSLALILGILAGTYSSLFLATPLLVIWLKWQKRI